MGKYQQRSTTSTVSGIDFSKSNFSEPSFPMDEGIIVLEKTTPISIDVFANVITQNHFALICTVPFL